MNEGFTVFLERQADKVLKGIDFYNVESLNGNDTLMDDFNNFGITSNYTSLHPSVLYVNPDDSFSTVPYEKGFQFLVYIESLLGADLMQKLLNSYILHYSERSVTYKHFEEYLKAFLFK